jgi:hypothetical protein
MRPSRIQVALSTAIMAAAVLALSVQTASAQTNVDYCQGIVTPPRTRCSDLAPRHHYNYNYAQGTRDGTWYWEKCERMYYWNVYDQIYSRNCNHARQTAGAYDDWCGGCGPAVNDSTLLGCAVGNNEASLHQRMYGNALYGSI